MKPDTNNPGSLKPEQISGPIRVAETAPQAPTNGHPAAAKVELPSSNNGNTASPPATPTKPPEEQTTAFEHGISAMTAEDADIIEKEWVDKVDHVIGTTSNDPYYQDQGHHALAKHYLKKRFNLDLDN